MCNESREENAVWLIVVFVVVSKKSASRKMIKDNREYVLKLLVESFL